MLTGGVKVAGGHIWQTDTLLPQALATAAEPGQRMTTAHMEKV